VNAASIHDHLATLRESGAALRRRPVEATLAVLANVLDGWCDPESSWRRALAAELPQATGFSPEVVREGLRLGLEPWSGARLRELVDRELAGSRGRPQDDGFVTGFDTTAVVLAGAIPTPTLLALIAPRPVYVASADEDRWADPRGEFLALLHALGVYHLLGVEDARLDRMPAPGEAIVNAVGYHLRRGRHDLTAWDWDHYLDFADRHLGLSGK